MYRIIGGAMEYPAFSVTMKPLLPGATIEPERSMHSIEMLKAHVQDQLGAHDGRMLA